jgi:hypothetical protein
MDQLGVFPALLNDSLNVKLWLFNEIIYRLNTAEDAIFILVFVNSQVWLSRNQQSVLVYQRPDTKAQKIACLLHEIR